MAIQITRNGLKLPSSYDEIIRQRKVFSTQYAVLLSNFIDSESWSVVQQTLAYAEFAELSYDGIGTEDCITDESTPCYQLLMFLMNNPALFTVIREITNCGPISTFVGRVYRMSPTKVQQFEWHDDVLDGRMIGMSVNLSSTKYQGGEFQLRDRRSGQILYEHANTGFGDALLFQIAPFLEHRVMPIKGGGAKTSFAGWFLSVSGLKST